MTKKIGSYDDLLKEKRRLELLLQAQREVIYYDIQEIKEELQPVKKVLEFLKKITTKDKTNLLLTLGSDLAINALVKRFLLQKAGWVARNVVPFFMKNYSSHFLSEQKEKWIEKLRSWLRHTDGKHTADKEEEEAD
jgi:hypothetical protein